MELTLKPPPLEGFFSPQARKRILVGVSHPPLRGLVPPSRVGVETRPVNRELKNGGAGG